MARERSRREKIQHFPSPGPVLTKMCKFLAMVRKISLDFLARSCWREKKSTFSLAGGSQREKIWFFYQKNSCHELNQPDLSRLMVSRERNCGLVIKVLCSLNEFETTEVTSHSWRTLRDSSTSFLLHLLSWMNKSEWNVSVRVSKNHKLSCKSKHTSSGHTSRVVKGAVIERENKLNPKDNKFSPSGMTNLETDLWFSQTFVMEIVLTLVQSCLRRRKQNWCCCPWREPNLPRSWCNKTGSNQLSMMFVGSLEPHQACPSCFE